MVYIPESVGLFTKMHGDVGWDRKLRLFDLLKFFLPNLWEELSPP